MKISPADTCPQTSAAPSSLEERLAASLAENARLTALVEEQATIIAELRQEIVALKQENADLKQENLALRERLNRNSTNSTNSNQPPSQDNPFSPPPNASQQRSGSGAGQEALAPSAGKKSLPYHKGAQQQRLKPDRIILCPPGQCSCGCRTFVDLHDLWPHQWIELLAHPMEVGTPNLPGPLIRRARGLSECTDAATAQCGWWGLLELRRLCGMLLETPEKEGAACRARLPITP